jgi:hypothetical protein
MPGGAEGTAGGTEGTAGGAAGIPEERPVDETQVIPTQQPPPRRVTDTAFDLEPFDDRPHMIPGFDRDDAPTLADEDTSVIDTSTVDTGLVAGDTGDAMVISNDTADTTVVNPGRDDTVVIGSGTESDAERTQVIIPADVDTTQALPTEDPGKGKGRPPRSRRSRNPRRR